MKPPMMDYILLGYRSDF